MFIIGLPSYTWISGSLNYLFDPPMFSIAALFDKFPAPWFFIIITILNLSFFMLMFLGVGTRWTSLFFSITCILGHNFWYSFGKIDHLILWYLAPAFLGFAGWGKYFSINIFKKNYLLHEVRINTNAMLILLFALSIGFSMFTSAAQKISGGWLSWSGEGVRFNFLRNYLSLNRNNLLTEPLLGLQNHLFWKFMDYAALVLEFGFILSTIRISYFRLFITVGVIFHILVLLMFNIPFYSNLIVYLIFIDWKLLQSKWGLQILYHAQERLIVKMMVCLSVLLTSLWGLLLINKTYFFTFPGLLEFVLGIFSIPNSFEVSLSLFFLLVFIFTVYMVYCHIELYIKKNNKIYTGGHSNV